MNEKLEGAIQAVGGPTEATHILRCSSSGLWKWRFTYGFIMDGPAARRLAEQATAKGFAVTTDELVDDRPSTNGQPKGGKTAARQRTSATSPDSPATEGGVSPAYPASPGTATAPSTQALAA